jgi:hypothetical protein
MARFCRLRGLNRKNIHTISRTHKRFYRKYVIELKIDNRERDAAACGCGQRAAAYLDEEAPGSAEHQNFRKRATTQPRMLASSPGSGV